jgi:hypothetical protein
MELLARPEPRAWYSRYKSMKKKFKDMYAIRVTSVEEESKVVRDRMAEHRRLHEETVSEIKEEIIEFQQMIEDAATMKSEIKRME